MSADTIDEGHEHRASKALEAYSSKAKNKDARKMATNAMVSMARELDRRGHDVDIVRWAKDAQYILVMDAQIRAGMWGKEKAE